MLYYYQLSMLFQDNLKIISQEDAIPRKKVYELGIKLGKKQKNEVRD